MLSLTVNTWRPPKTDVNRTTGILLEYYQHFNQYGRISWDMMIYRFHFPDVPKDFRLMPSTLTVATHGGNTINGIVLSKSGRSIYALFRTDSSNYQICSTLKAHHPDICKVE